MAKKERLTKEDCDLMIQMIETMSKRGVIKGEELATAGYLFMKIKSLWQ